MTDQDLSIGELRERARFLWNEACKWDGFAPNSPQLVFSEENPFVGVYQRAYLAWRKLRYPEMEE